MRLQPSTLTSRNFLIQLSEIEKEFGQEIPWFKGLHDLRYITNKNVFAEKVKELTGSAERDTIKPYLLVTNGKEREYIGGVLHFSQSPEKFLDSNNQVIQNQLESSGHSYVTCLQLREVFRNKLYGTELTSKALSTILQSYPRVWAVVSHPELLHWYQYFGAEIQNTIENEDRLVIITFDQSTFRKRR